MPEAGYTALDKDAKQQSEHTAKRNQSGDDMAHSVFHFPLGFVRYKTLRKIARGRYLISALINLSVAEFHHQSGAMQVTVGKHIEQLQDRREKLNAYLMNSKLKRVQRNRIEAEIRWVDLALGHFRAALAAEKKIPASTGQ